MSQYIIGIDVGGTNVKLGLVNRSGRIIARNSLITKTYIRTQKVLIEAFVQGVRDILAAKRLTARKVSGIGIGLPGLVNPQKGIVTFLPNIPGWRNVPLKSILQRKLRIRTFLENDVNMITLGEWKYGAGRRCKNLVCITLGTGVGGGLILDNQLYRGEGFVAGEVGHIPLNEKGPQCNCGGSACFERYVGNRHLHRAAEKVFRKRSITLEEISTRARRGERKAVRFWEDTAVHIGNGLTGVVNLLNPARVIIGGGVANAPHFLIRRIEKTIRSRAMSVQGSMVKVSKAALGNDAGLIGARVLVEGGG